MTENYHILVDQLMRQGMTEEDALACADREFDVVLVRHKEKEDFSLPRFPIP